MEIIKLNPSGFCYGVKRSYEETINTIKNNQDKTIYLLGWLVHNKNVINYLQEQGLKILDDTNISRYDLINNLVNSSNRDIIILSAHGTDYQAIELAKQKGYEIVDLTCPYVYKTHLLIKNKIAHDTEVFFIGKKNHPETKAILKINPHIKLISNFDDIEKLDIKQNKCFCTNQTTLSFFQIQDFITNLKLKRPQLEFINDICDATTKRQQALYDVDKDVDIILVLGDQKSSNSLELLKIAKDKCDAYMISNLEDINLKWFNNKNKCVVVSAASCPEILVDKTISFLNKEINNEA